MITQYQWNTIPHNITVPHNTTIVDYIISLEYHCTIQYHNSAPHNTTIVDYTMPVEYHTVYHTIPVPVDYTITLTGTVRGSHAMNETGS